MWKKQISTWQLWFTAVGGIVGSGWLLGPYYAAQHAGPASIIAWALGGGLMLFIALTFAELASSLPLAGGMARYAQFTHGTLVSFVIAWIAYMAAVVVPPIETMAGIQYAANYFPFLMQHNNAHHLSATGIAISIFILLSLCVINFYAVRVFAKSNAWIVIWKIIIPVIAALLLFHTQFHPQNLTSHGGFFSQGWHAIFTALPTAGIIFSFIGYSPAIQLAGEAKNPQTAIPFAIIGSIIFAILLYTLVELAFVGALPPALLTHGWSHLHFLQDSGPVAGLMTILGVGWFLKVIYVDAILSPLGTAFIYTASTARMTYAMSQNGYLPSSLQKQNQHLSPTKAITLNFIVGALFFLPFPGWQDMVGFLVSCFVLSYIVGPIAAVSLRHDKPHLKRPFQLKGLPIIAFIAFVICNCLVYWTGWPTVWRLMLVIVIGLLYLTGYRLTRTNSPPLHYQEAQWLWPYLLGLTLISYAGNYGGHDWLPFGWDMLVITVFSACIWFYALHCRIKNPDDPDLDQ